jgi:hypothetical protein
MPEISNDERGRRRFQIQKEQAVEKVMDKLRTALGPEFHAFTAAELENVKYVLGETWVSMERATWERCSFTRLKKSDVDYIAQYGKQARRSQRAERRAVEKVSALLAQYA